MAYYYKGRKLSNFQKDIREDNVWINFGFKEEHIRTLLKRSLEILETWNSGITDLTGFFKNDTDLEYMPFVDTNKVTSMKECFTGCSNLKEIPKLDTRNVTDMSGCFAGCTNIGTVELDTRNVTNMDNCFSGCSNLITYPHNFRNVTSMYGCFRHCRQILEIAYLNTQNVTNMKECFQGCSKLHTIRPKLDLEKVTDMSYCFSGCSNLTTISELDTSNVTNIRGCFKYCGFKKVPSISFKSMGSILYPDGFIFGDITSTDTTLRYLLIKDIGTNPDCTIIDATNAGVWGIANTEVPDARQSLIDSLLTYSFNRRAAGYSDCTIKLYSTVKALLTEDEINQIQAKGYIIS